MQNLDLDPGSTTYRDDERGTYQEDEGDTYLNDGKGIHNGVTGRGHCFSRNVLTRSF